MRSLRRRQTLRRFCPRPDERTQRVMIKVKLRGNETAEQMMRRFKKMCEKEGLTKEIKRLAYYEKPSEKRRRRRKGGGLRTGRPAR